MSLANSLRTLQAYIQAVGTQLGAGLAAAIRHVVVWLNELMKYVLKAATAFATFMQTIFGKYKGGASGIAMEGLGDAADYADDLSDASAGAADGLGSASDAAKQLKKDLSVLPFDELNQLNKDRESTSSGSGGAGAGGGVGGGGLMDGLLDWGDVDNSPLGKLPDWISKWAKAIKDAIKLGDFDRVGEIIADGLNKGIDKLYEILDPEKAKAKIFPFIDAITTSFNSIVDNLHWETLGRAFGRGINIIVSSLNRFIEGIDWKNLGRKLAKGANGLVDEVDFHEVGRLIGNRFMVVWDILNGFVHDFNWAKFGVQIGNLINGLFERVNFSTIADTLATGLNGLFETLKNEAATIHWGDIADNISNGIITFIEETKWEENGESLKLFITNLCDAIIRAVDNVGEEKWEELGNGIATTLAGLPWSKILKTVGHVIVTALGGRLKGMLSEPEGILAVAIMGGLALLKFKNSAFGSFAGHLAEAITGKSVSDTITNGLKKMLKGSVTTAAGDKAVTAAGKTAGANIGLAIKEGLSAFLPAAGIAALIAGGTTAAIYGVAEAEKGLEKKRGGNGELTYMGTQLQDLLTYLGQTNKLTEEQWKSLFLLKENMESTGASTNEMASGFVQKYIEMGGSVQDLNGYVESLMFTAQSETDTFEALQYAVEHAGEKHGFLGQKVDNVKSKYEQFAESAKNNSSSMSNAVSNASSVAKSKLQEQIDNLGRTASEYSSASAATSVFKTETETSMNSAGISVSNFKEFVQKGMANAKSALLDAANQSTEFKTTTDANLTTSGGIVNDLASKIKLMSSNSQTQYNNLNKSALTNLQGINKQTQDTIKETDKMSPAMEKSASNTSNAFGKGILAMVAHMVNLGVKLASATAAITVAMGKEGQSAGESYARGINAGFSMVDQAVQNLASNLNSNLNIDLYSAGQQAGQSFANGISSTYIPAPHIYVSAWNALDYGNGYTYYPNFSVGWWRAGGLFKGGNGHVIGIAEDNRDEAVLPLEDRRAMSRIGSAIAEAGGSNGVTDETVNKLAVAIAGIMMNTQSNNNDQMNYIELKVEDEVLARAVTRGQQKLDYRHNPTPKMSMA